VNAIAIEAFLARLYTDDRLRGEFLAAPRAIAMREGLGVEEATAVESIDRVGLELAADSYAHKRAGRGRGSGKRAP
jgi:hypothetical protein